MVEIAAGEVPKIGIGLAGINFRGTLILVEPEHNSAVKIYSQYRKLLPNANLTVLEFKLDDAMKLLPSSIDLVASNHPLDDMIVGEFLEDSAFQSFFNDHYVSPAEETRLIWNQLEATGIVERLKTNVLNSWENVLRHMQPKTLIISQYESFFFKKNGIEAPDRHALEVLKLVRSKAVGKYRYTEIPIHNSNIIQSDRWIAFHRHTHN